MSAFFDKITRIRPYLYEVSYSELDYEYAWDYFRKHTNKMAFGCSSVRNGDFYGRNFDWIYDESCTFIVHTPAKDGLNATLSVAGGMQQMTDKFVNSGADSILYKIVPFMTMDGINSHGVVCNTNVVPRDYSTGPIQPVISTEITINALMIPRYVLDYFSTAREAVNYLRDYAAVYFSKTTQSMGYELHIMIADSTDTFVVEFVNGRTEIIDVRNRPYMTNFFIYGTSGNSVTTPETATEDHKPSDDGITNYGDGLERYNLINSLYELGHTKDGMRIIMDELIYTQSYKPTTSPFWYSEFVGDNVTVDSPLSDFIPAVTKAQNVYKNRSREVDSPYYGTWHTIHSSVYDIKNKKLYIKVQEDNVEYEFPLKGGSGMKELLQVGSSFNTPVRVFAIDSPEEVEKLPKNVPMGSYAECITEDGLRVFMLRKTADEPDNGDWVEI